MNTIIVIHSFLCSLNDSLAYQLLEANANTNITIPNGFKEAIIHVLIESSAERIITFSIAKNLLTTGTQRALRGGYYENAGNNAYVNAAVKVNANETCTVNATKVVLAGSDVTSTSYVKIAYR